MKEAIDAAWPLSSVLYTEVWAEKHSGMLGGLVPQARQQCVSENVLRFVSTTENPDGVVAIAVERDATTFNSAISLAVAVERLQSPGNLGTLIRVSTAAGADGIWMTADSVDPTHPKVLRASAGQWFRQPPRVVSLVDWLDSRRREGTQVLAAATEGRALWDFDLKKPTVFLLGNEGAGLSWSMRDSSDDVISIPMATGIESLNVATSGGLLLYEAVRQRKIARD